MYYPIIKNKLNELKGLNAVDVHKTYKPILELTDTKYDSIEKLFNDISRKIENVLSIKHVLIDIPSYLNNDITKAFNLNDAESKFKFFLDLNNLFKSKNYKDFVPVISFDYSYGSQRQCFKENIKFAKKIIENFDKFSFRLFSDSAYRKDDMSLFDQINAFYDDEMEGKYSLIYDCNNGLSLNENKKVITTLYNDYKINEFILVDEAFSNATQDRVGTDFQFDRVKNKHLKHFYQLKNELNYNLSYSDYTLVEKIQSKLEIDPDKGFLYYPFIKFTTEDGNLCRFAADEKGKYEQYGELCRRIKNEIRNFSSQHCDACDFINKIVNNEDVKYKAGSTWKYRMIAHHIESISMLGV